METISLKQNVAWNTLGSVFYQGCLWLITVLVVRLSNDYQNSGSLAFAMSVGNLAFALGTYNMRTFQVADTNKRHSSENYIALRLITMVISGIFFGIYAAVISPNPNTLLVTLSFILFKLDESFANVFYGIDQTFMRLDIVGKSMLIRGILCVSSFSLGLKFSGNLNIAILEMYVSCLLITIFYDRVMTKKFESNIKPHISIEMARELLKRCLPSVLALLISTLVVSIARQYYGVVYGENSLGIYASVATPCVVIQVLAQNIYLPFLGPIAESFNMGSKQIARKKFLKLFEGVLLLGLILSLILALFSNPLLIALYGKSIEPYIWLLLPVLVVTTEAACTGLITDSLVVFNKLNSTLIVNSAALIITMLTISSLCQQFDMNGISLALIGGFTASIGIGLILIIKATVN